MRRRCWAGTEAVASGRCGTTVKAGGRRSGAAWSRRGAGAPGETPAGAPAQGGEGSGSTVPAHPQVLPPHRAGRGTERLSQFGQRLVECRDLVGILGDPAVGSDRRSVVGLEVVPELGPAGVVGDRQSRGGELQVVEPIAEQLADVLLVSPQRRWLGTGR